MPSRLVTDAAQHAVMVVGTYPTAVVTISMRASVAIRAAVIALEKGQRGPGAAGRLQDVRRVRAVALEGLRWAVVYVVRHEWGVAVVGLVERRMLHLMRHAGRVVMDGRIDMMSLQSRHTEP